MAGRAISPTAPIIEAAAMGVIFIDLRIPSTLMSAVVAGRVKVAAKALPHSRETLGNPHHHVAKPSLAIGTPSAAPKPDVSK